MAAGRAMAIVTGRAFADLTRATLIGVTTFPLAWPAWFASAGAPELRPQRAI